MKNKIKFFIGAGIFCILLAGNSFAQSFKVGYVDTVKVFYSYYKTKKDMKVWQSAQAAQESKIANLQKEVKTLQDNYNKQKNLLKPEDAKKKEAEIGKKINDLMSLENLANQTLTKEKDDMITKLKNEIYTAVKNFAQNEKYDLILDSQAVIYSSGDNITNQIITVLNKGETKPTK